MKNVKKTIKLISVLILFLLSASAFGQFKGKMVFDSMNEEHSYDVYYCDLGYRYEFNEDGQKGIVIVKSGAQEVLILMPEQKMAMKTPSNNPMSMANDPLQSFEYYKDSGNFEEAGEELINGILCKKSTLYNKENPSQKMFTMWYSEDYKFPMKMINHIDGSEDSKMEMQDVRSWKPDPSMFEIPADYQLMDVPGMMPDK
ncbi:MAG TPA: hypothetical protein VK870_07990 [Ignavibacteriaceae bacterium]|nr:hypothetical protein [Ignavibacteriaceae bacterium]